MEENTKDETIKHLEELFRQKSDLIENMEQEIKRLRGDKIAICKFCGDEIDYKNETPFHKIISCGKCGHLQSLMG